LPLYPHSFPTRRSSDLRPGEGFITALMFFHIFATLTFYYILKPMRSSFFLKNLPSSKLPFAYILTAILAGTLTTLVFKFSRRISDRKSTRLSSSHDQIS